MQNKIKIGDYVVKNDLFKEHWTSKEFSIKVINIDIENCAELEHEIEITNVISRPIGPHTSKIFHCNFFDVDKKRMREEKLKKLEYIQKYIIK